MNTVNQSNFAAIKSNVSKFHCELNLYFSNSTVWLFFVIFLNRKICKNLSQQIIYWFTVSRFLMRQFYTRN